MINGKWQGDRIAKHLRYDDLLSYTFITQSSGEIVDCVIRPICFKRLSSKMQNSPDK